jgi:pimeloyl-ACP methyl ester carboxylesterase
MTTTTTTTGVAAGVPYLATSPEGGPRADAPVVVAWHLMDAPCTEAALAAALPLAGLDAWRIYLGLPLHGARQPAGGFQDLLRLAQEDAVLKLYGPLTAQAAAEFPPALAALRSQLGFGEGPIGVVGGSIGAAVAALVLAESGAPIDAAVLISPVVQLAPLIEAMAGWHGLRYAWSPASRQVADRLDFVARVEQLTGSREPAVQLVLGADDDEAFCAPARRLHDALGQRYADPSRVELVMVPGMEHALADEPGIEPAPQTPHAAVVDRHASAWLARHLGPAA